MTVSGNTGRNNIIIIILITIIDVAHNVRFLLLCFFLFFGLLLSRVRVINTIYIIRDIPIV
ncbi:uncharacterized protein BT62DRAFT_938921 [Guyanagaster necrorhizus]|uniref:Uncharacterized protein n=1 Tax=Guyanagaster necrorhizus TaxID=856835 RepID=A0A9P7VFA1_9AGAR|nr:uncharacterized protein BT62DRAFT_938921 [Guyanagaster necrorhizus MCA 3950]KAG7439480.1 hypothetical protein BT62DRAFT_938921 [Guyanagaster necrorhizus MCA 3950]